MMATSIPPSSKSPHPPPPPPPHARPSERRAAAASRSLEMRRAPRSFQCTDELWRAFTARAAQLECSPDWLLSEAMKRLLESGPGAANVANVPPPQEEARKTKSLPPMRPPPPPPLQMQRRPTPQPIAAAAQQPPKGLVLVVNGTRTAVERHGFVIGRSARDAQLVLRDPGVSRQHAIVERFSAAYVIVDMASTNGVIVNGTRVSRCVLRTGDLITIGPFTIEVERGGMV